MKEREDYIKFYEWAHRKLGVKIDVPVGISIIEDVDEYLKEQSN